jgi:ABC-type antimicrobial peptide transport system permease subunit
MLIVAAAVLGIPFGILVAHATWSLTAAQLGVVVGPIVPPLAIVIVVVAALVVANMVAAGPAWRSGRIQPADALRSE